MASTRVAIGLGSNLGDRLAHLRAGWAGLESVLRDVSASAVYSTNPMHVERQAEFLNACCTGWTDLEPQALLTVLLRIERQAGRVRTGPRYGPRTLDLDLLLYGDLALHTAELTLPHPRLRERAFVLVPLAELAAGWQVPGGVRTIRELAMGIDRSGVRRTELALAGLEPDSEQGA